jgi:hypothetical protein
MNEAILAVKIVVGIVALIVFLKFPELYLKLPGRRLPFYGDSGKFQTLFGKDRWWT